MSNRRPKHKLKDPELFEGKDVRGSMVSKLVIRREEGGGKKKRYRW
jgi:hypothetical protein